MSTDRFSVTGPHDVFAEWDAAYVLGALSATDRLAFETHLRECNHCAVAVANLAGVPGILGAVPAVDALAMIPGHPTTDHLPRTLLPVLAGRVRRHRRIRTWATALVGMAAAASIVAAVTLPMSLDAPMAPTVSASLEHVVASPITADVQLTSEAWGTRITMLCTYHAPGPGQPTTGYRLSAAYGLFVTDRAGQITQVSSWTAGPGSTISASGSIDVPVSDIVRVQLRALGSGVVLLSHDMG